MKELSFFYIHENMKMKNRNNLNLEISEIIQLERRETFNLIEIEKILFRLHFGFLPLFQLQFHFILMNENNFSIS